jgi:hypothetical protein
VKIQGLFFQNEMKFDLHPNKFSRDSQLHACQAAKVSERKKREREKINTIRPRTHYIQSNKQRPKVLS